MNAFKSTARVVSAWLVSHLSATVLMIFVSSWLLTSHSSLEQRDHVIATAALIALYFSAGSALLNLLDIKVWKSTIVLGGIVMLVLCGATGDVLLRANLPELAGFLLLMGTPAFGISFVSSFLFDRVSRKMKG